MSERQEHGFEFQHQVARDYGLVETLGYTDEWDAKLDGVPVSIKAIREGSDITLSDCSRNARISEDFFLIVGFWTLRPDGRAIIRRQMLKLPAAEWKRLFCPELIAESLALLSEISNHRADDAKWRTRTRDIKSRWEAQTPNLIRLRFKRDHKSQKRLQCAINYRDFWEHFVATYEANAFFGATPEPGSIN